MRLALSMRLWLYASAAVLWVSGTAWLFAHEALDGKVDTLVIDYRLHQLQIRLRHS